MKVSLNIYFLCQKPCKLIDTYKMSELFKRVFSTWLAFFFTVSSWLAKTNFNFRKLLFQEAIVNIDQKKKKKL